eukprot:g1703.t1
MGLYACATMTAIVVFFQMSLRPCLGHITHQGNQGRLHGYVENWVTDYQNPSEDTYGAYDSLFYSFLTLDKTPNVQSPRAMYWDGLALYDSMTQTDINVVMKDDPTQYDTYWHRQNIKGLMDWCSQTHKKFIWAIGGWSDLLYTIRDDQIDLFVEQVVTLLTNYGGDGVDLDWEHVSHEKFGNTTIYEQQRQIVGKTIAALRLAFDANPALNHMEIVYTPRYNAFFSHMTSTMFHHNEFATDGEGLDVVDTVDQLYPDGGFHWAVDYVHLMMYDIAANEAFHDTNSPVFERQHYDAVVQSAYDAGVDSSMIVMGYSPGKQAHTGVWGGLNHTRDTMENLQGCVGGSMFWASNDNGQLSSNSSTMGENCATLAHWAVETFPTHRINETCGVPMVITNETSTTESSSMTETTEMSVLETTTDARSTTTSEMPESSATTAVPVLDASEDNDDDSIQYVIIVIVVFFITLLGFCVYLRSKCAFSRSKAQNASMGVELPSREGGPSVEIKSLDTISV